MTELELGLIKYFIEYQIETNMILTKNINIQTKTQEKNIENITLDDIDFIDIVGELYTSVITIDNLNAYQVLDMQKTNLARVLNENYYLDDAEFYPIEISTNRGWYTVKYDIKYHVDGKFKNIDAIKTFLKKLDSTETN